jgi:hypothetical protein
MWAVHQWLLSAGPAVRSVSQRSVHVGCRRRFVHRCGLLSRLLNRFCATSSYACCGGAMPVIFIVLAAYAHKKRVNMSALGIGVDFLQIMSIFTNFGFKWPASLKKLFQYSSLSTFNDQMMAPECTVTTWTFENKYGWSFPSWNNRIREVC